MSDATSPGDDATGGLERLEQPTFFVAQAACFVAVPTVLTDVAGPVALALVGSA